MAYFIKSYRTPEGVRDVLLVRMPTDDGAFALVDVAPPLDFRPVIVKRNVPDLVVAGRLADAHVAESAACGEPARGERLFADLHEINAMQRERAAALAIDPEA